MTAASFSWAFAGVQQQQVMHGEHGFWMRGAGNA